MIALGKEAVLAAMHRYSVRKHYRASTTGRRTLYAVFADGEQLTEPADHCEAQEARELLIAQDIVDMAEAGRAA